MNELKNNQLPVKKNTNTKRTECTVWSRVVGYLRPTSRWNEGKRSEFNDRLMFKTN